MFFRCYIRRRIARGFRPEKKESDFHKIHAIAMKREKLMVSRQYLPVLYGLFMSEKKIFFCENWRYISLNSRKICVIFF